MKIACLSYFLPGKENNQGPNSLIYQIIAHRPREVAFDLFVPQSIFDKKSGAEIVAIERDLGVKIRPLKTRHVGTIERLTTAWWPAGARVHLDIDVLYRGNYDLVWGYPFWTAPYVHKIPGANVISGMDSVTLLYLRKVKSCIASRSTKTLKYMLALARAAMFELFFLRHRKVHVVGQSDCATLRRLGVYAFYTPHPTNPMTIGQSTIVRAQAPKTVRVLFSNSLDGFYGSPTVLSWLRELLRLAIQYANTEIEIIFHKGDVERLKSFVASQQIPDGVSVSFVGWIDDYEAFLETIDIQIFPLDVGAGTKTSVLTALYMNVICIGTRIATENINVLPTPQYLLSADSLDEFSDRFKAAMEMLHTRQSYPAGHLVGSSHSPESSGASFWKDATSNNV